MADYARSGSWRDELATLVGDDGAAFLDDGAPAEGPAGGGGGEGWKEQAKEFLSAAAELAAELGRGCRDIARQSLASEELSAAVKRLAGPCAAVSRRLRFLNEYLPEDKDPVHAWPVVVFVFLLALSGD